MKRTIFIGALLLFATMAAFSTPLTIDDAIRSAKTYNADYSLASRRYADTVAITNKQNSLTPSLSLNSSVSTNAGFFSPSGSDVSWNGVSGSVGISTSINFTGSVLTEKKTKTLSNEEAYLELEAEALSLESEVIDGYISIATTRAALDLAEITLQTAKDQLSSISEKHSAGLASDLELIQAENNVEEEEYNLQSLNSQYLLYVMSFENLTGLDVTDLELIDISSIEVVEIPSAENLFDKFAYNSPAIKEKDLAVRASELSYTTTRNDSTLPSFSLSAGYTIDGSYNSGLDGFSDGFSASASISIPLDTYFPSSSKAASVASAKNSAEYARVELANALVQFRYTLQESVQNINLQGIRIENQEKNISALEKEYSLAKQSYDVGEISLSTLQTTEKSLKNAKNTLLDYKSTYLQSLYTLSQTLGISYSQLLEA